MMIINKKTYGPQFFTGLAFSGAFISALFPFPGLTFAAYLPFLLFFIYEKHAIERLRFTKIVPLLCFVSFYYIFWLAIDQGEYIRATIVRLIYFYAMAFAFVFGRVVDDPREFMRGFWWALLPLSVISALLGVVKVALQSRGYIIGQLDFFYQMAGVGYPYGSSLITDYNIYASSLMVAMVGFILKINRSGFKVGFWNIVAVAIILLNIYMCGSRRTYAIFIVLYALVLFLFIMRKNKKSVLGFLAVSFLIFLLIYILSDHLISPAAVGRYTVISPMCSSSGSMGGEVFTYRPQDLISSVSSDQSFGLSSRLIRWKFALNLLENGDWLFGDGFSYQYKYSCEFSGCAAVDYPHNIFLSEWLLAGLLGVLAMAFIFCMILFELLRRGERFISSGVFLILFIVLPGAFISGDGVFSVPQVLVVIMMAFIYSYQLPVRRSCVEQLAA